MPSAFPKMTAGPDFAGRTVVVTGAGGGLGSDIARRFGEAGAFVVVAEIAAAAGRAVADQLRGDGIEAVYRPLDVRDPASSASLVEAVTGERGGVDVWVNNAGVAHKGPAETLPPEEWRESIDVMLSGAFYCSQAAARPMLEQGRGVIVNVASIIGCFPIEQRVAYGTAKAGLIALTEALGIEWADRGVRVVGVAPAVVMTEMVQKGLAEGTATVDAYERRTPMRRLGTKREVSDAVLYLAGDEASFITAETLKIDGGWGAYSFF